MPDSYVPTWTHGNCDSYALALIQKHPHLKLAVIGHKEQEGWWPTHYLAHDGKLAYDSRGSYELDQIAETFSVDVVELNQDLEDWFVDGEPENGDYRAEAHIDIERDTMQLHPDLSK